ncbi:helicase C-terminal domain-containing protein [Verminephrobacter eiseniae]|uniref:Helicase c2 n=2 Tax=Verminephrobacter eiseniae TaxID=364317 RepID=A1WP29_VEREI|nr:helicase C-terminal domain-containing protein [Verminephrobacter eiseniae]ABM59386.1 helicase c2 [Verminephrobacter eiseniae EF01-2]
MDELLQPQTTMANHHQTDLVAQVYRALTSVMPGFVARAQQKTMISRTLGLMTRQALGVIEAPTGIGKSMGYLIAGIASAVTEDKVLVVSTATASLQDQLASKDLPLALRAFALAGVCGIDVVVAKGRERHACPMKMHAFAGGTQDLFAAGDDHTALTQAVDLWRQGQWAGVRDDLPVRLHQRAWMRIANTAASCPGQKCPEFDLCPYYATQAALKTARVIITNHDYLLSTLSNVPHSVFSDGHKCLFVFDEAHHLSDKLLNAFARRLDLAAFPSEVIEAIAQLCPGMVGLDFAAERVRGIWRACEDAALTMLGDGSQHRFTLNEVPPQFRRLLLDLKAQLSGMRATLKEVKESNARFRNKAVAMLADSRIGQLSGDVQEAIDCIEEFTGDDLVARWLARGRNSIDLNCSPFDGARKARKHLWPVVKTGLLTSATLTTLGSFEPMRIALGLPAETSTLKLDSPFDYGRARLIVPRLCVEASDPAHSRMVAAFLKDHALGAAKHRGVLVYFTSKKLMLDCMAAIPTAQRGCILLQGQWQPWAMLEEHKRRIDAGVRSIIFGLDSIGEGVDLPGEYCTRVIMTRLPFPCPDDPVLCTHAEYLRSKGKDPFHILTMPKVGLKFAQVAGRLMRREQDWGEFYVLDKRLRSKRYGAQIVKSTPFRTMEMG